MALVRSIPNPVNYLPMGVRVFFRHRLYEAGGLGLIGLGGFLALAFASWSSSDPSWNRATGVGVENWMGQNGAVTADLAYQLLGLAGLFLVPLGVIWGWRLLTHQIGRAHV